MLCTFIRSSVFGCTVSKWFTSWLCVSVSCVILVADVRKNNLMLIEFLEGFVRITMKCWINSAIWRVSNIEKNDWPWVINISVRKYEIRKSNILRQNWPLLFSGCVKGQKNLDKFWILEGVLTKFWFFTENMRTSCFLRTIEIIWFSSTRSLFFRKNLKKLHKSGVKSYENVPNFITLLEYLWGILNFQVTSIFYYDLLVLYVFFSSTNTITF